MKRFFDILFSGLFLCICAPFLALIACAVRLFLGSPVLFIQTRPGLHGKPFTIFKFRTMLDATDAAGNPLSDAQRLTPFGHFLRASSLDELPEFWNVLRGDMSLVGPRPLLMEYLPLYSKEQTRRHDVRPGITGWAQIHGRNALSWDEKFALDLWYVKNQSLQLDLHILWKTLTAVLKRTGINASEEQTMPRFQGNAGQDDSQT